MIRFIFRLSSIFSFSSSSLDLFIGNQENAGDDQEESAYLGICIFFFIQEDGNEDERNGGQCF
jgi:hypothetical protein